MGLSITSRRAGTGLPDVANGCRCDDFTYYDDGTTTDDLAGSTLSGQQTMPVRKKKRQADDERDRPGD